MVTSFVRPIARTRRKARRRRARGDHVDSGRRSFVYRKQRCVSTELRQLSVGGAVAYNFNQFVGIEGEVSSSIGMSQSLDFGYPSTVRTPDVLTYSGNVVLSVPNGSSVVPYVTGGAGGSSLFSREAFGINETETLFAANVGGGVKWYAGRWGLRGDYRFIAVPSRDETSPFFGKEPRYGHRVYGAVMLNVGR